MEERLTKVCERYFKSYTSIIMNHSSQQKLPIYELIMMGQVEIGAFLKVGLKRTVDNNKLGSKFSEFPAKYILLLRSLYYFEPFQTPPPKPWFWSVISSQDDTFWLSYDTKSIHPGVIF
jgi:hypothetical protein